MTEFIGITSGDSDEERQLWEFTFVTLLDDFRQAVLEQHHRAKRDTLASNRNYRHELERAKRRVRDTKIALFDFVVKLRDEAETVNEDTEHG